MSNTHTERLEYLRQQIRNENISMSELVELQGLADQIDPGDVELLEWAGVPENKPTIPDEFRERNPYVLANLAGCASPDGLTSPGAQLLESVKTSVIEHWEYVDDKADFYDSDDITEICHEAPSLYTGELWAEFVDLAAWQEDVSEMEGSDMEGLARWALIQICERLAFALADELVDELVSA